MLKPAKARILLNEDDPDIREALNDLLVDEGYSTLFCATIAEARAHLRDGDAILLLDLTTRVADKSPTEWLEDFDRHGDGPCTVILSASAVAKAIGERFGIPVVKKPFGLDELVRAIADVASNNARPRDSLRPPSGEAR